MFGKFLFNSLQKLSLNFCKRLNNYDDAIPQLSTVAGECSKYDVERSNVARQCTKTGKLNTSKLLLLSN